MSLDLIHHAGITNIDCLRGLHGVKEPLAGKCNKIDWVIIGGESGPGARPCNVEWIRSLVQQCKAAGVSAWVKQMGSNAYSPSNPMWDNGITGKGTDPSEWPEDLRVQKFPFTEEAIAA
jgi:hypothetical protein